MGFLDSMVPYGRMELSEAEFHCPEILQFGEDNLCLAIMLTQHEHFRPDESGKQWDIVRGLLGKNVRSFFGGLVGREKSGASIWFQRLQ